MTTPTRIVPLWTALALLAPAFAAEPPPIKPIERRLPPMGIDLPPEVAAKLTARLVEVEKQLATLPDDTPNRADAAVFVKAVRFAVDLREFYDLKDIAKAERELDEAAARIDQLKAGKTPWLDVRDRTIVRGFVSRIDGSVQPYGVTIPAGLDLAKPAPLHVWLHGRGDRTTDIHFIDGLSRGKCQWVSDKAIVIQPFGRQCIGWKGPGEIDVFEAIDATDATWPIDRDRIALCGFSMGGAGAWHIGAHYADRFAVVHAGAGFVDTARYQGVDPATVGDVERTLWGVYDVPVCVRNLFNVPVIAYSGELDKQKASADIMEEAFAAEDRKLTRIIGPQMGHKYDPDSLAQVHAFVDAAVTKGRNPMPDRVHLQTRTPRYGRMFWLLLLAMDESWVESRIDGEIVEPGHAKITTRNVAAMRLDRDDLTRFTVDDQELRLEPVPPARSVVLYKRADGVWRMMETSAWTDWPPRKGPRLPGPIDDAFMGPFLVVLPSNPAADPRVRRWVEFESQRFIRRWRELFRGDVRVKLDGDVTPYDMQRYNLIVWGDLQSHDMLRQMHKGLPIEWTAEWITMHDRRFPAAALVPAFIAPNPHHGGRYVVINSGPTFREADDRTNSLQNPKLGDWAIIDVSVDPDDTQPGRIVESGFFDESWKRPAPR